MAKIVLFQPGPLPSKDIFFMKAIEKGMARLVRQLSLQTQIHCLWRMEFYWILLKTHIQKSFFRVAKWIFNKKLMLNFNHGDKKTHYVPAQPSRKGISKMSCIAGGDGRVKSLVSRSVPAAKVIAFK